MKIKYFNQLNKIVKGASMEFKISSTEEQKIKGMTVFNTEEVNTKKQPMFFGQPLGVQRYDSYKYPVFDKLTQQQLSYFWRPEEISLQKDRGDYQTLRTEQKHIFTSNLKRQILLDSVQGRAPSLAFLPICSLPELETWIQTWALISEVAIGRPAHCKRSMLFVCGMPNRSHV